MKNMKNMRNRMEEYLGSDYSQNHVRNFCLYWIKGLERRTEQLKEKGLTLRDVSGTNFTDEMCEDYDAWRRDNDLDCLYFDGDLRADTLMSAWTPIKWVADYINKEFGKEFFKPNKYNNFSMEDLRLLADETERYLPEKNDLVRDLNWFLEKAEERCNYILLPDRKMNPERFSLEIDGRRIWLYDMVPATLYHIFDKNSLGKYFRAYDPMGENEMIGSFPKQELDLNRVKSWIKREHLDMGFTDYKIDRDSIIPLIPGLDPSEAKKLTERNEIKAALKYMYDFLSNRKEKLLIDEYVSRTNVTRITEKPQRLMTDGLWDIYNMLFNQEKPYIWNTVECRSRRRGQKMLFYIADITLHYDMKYYYYDNTGCELPDFEDEYIEMTLLRIDNVEFDFLGNKFFQKDFLCQEIVKINEKTVRRVLEDLSQENEIDQQEFFRSVLSKEGLRIASDKEILESRFSGQIPVAYF